MSSVSRHLALGTVLALGTIGCANLAPYTPLTRSTRGVDPDAVYHATLRVFARRGWPVETSNAESREVRSQTVPFLQLGLTSGAVLEDYGAAVAVRVNEGAIEVQTSCAWSAEAQRLNGASEPCADGDRPAGLHERELDLVSDILDEALARGAVSAGCARDVECKGDRICSGGRCADPTH